MKAIRSVNRSMIALAGATVGLTLAGCASSPRPSHVAQFWTQWNEDVTIVLRGQKPTIEITNNGPGPIEPMVLNFHLMQLQKFFTCRKVPIQTIT